MVGRAAVAKGMQVQGQMTGNQPPIAVGIPQNGHQNALQSFEDEVLRPKEDTVESAA